MSGFPNQTYFAIQDIPYVPSLTNLKYHERSVKNHLGHLGTISEIFSRTISGQFGGQIQVQFHGQFWRQFHGQFQDNLPVIIGHILCISISPNKVIIDKSCGGVSLVVQDTIELCF